MTNLSLFNISLEFRALDDLMQDEYDPISGEYINKDKEIEDLFNSLEMEFKEKLDNSQRYCLSLDADAETLAKEIKRLQAKKKAIENNKDRLRTMMLGALKASGLPKLKTDLYSFTIKKTESVNIINEDLLSRNYLRMKFEADKVKIKEALKSGEVVDGAAMQTNEAIGVR